MMSLLMGYFQRGLLGLTSLMGLLASYFQGPSWAYFTYESSNCYSTWAFLGLFTYEPSSGLLYRGLLGLTSLTILEPSSGLLYRGLLGLVLVMSLPGLLHFCLLGLNYLRAF